MSMNMNELLRGAMKRKPVAAAAKATLDGVGDDDSLGNADDYTIADISMAAVAAVQQWSETDDLGDGETYADRLMALFVGIADANKDGDISDDEWGVMQIALNAAGDYLLKVGVTEDDTAALLNDWDADVAQRVRDLVLSALPDGEDAASADIDRFIFSDEDQEPALDAVYRKVVAIRNGKKMRINKRISGKVRLSAAQKVAIRKARAKSHSAAAMMRRIKSMKKRQKAGL